MPPSPVSDPAVDLIEAQLQSYGVKVTYEQSQCLIDQVQHGLPDNADVVAAAWNCGIDLLGFLDLIDLPSG